MEVSETEPGFNERQKHPMRKLWQEEEPTVEQCLRIPTERILCRLNLLVEATQLKERVKNECSNNVLSENKYV